MQFGHLLQLTFHEFKNNYPFNCFDLSMHDRNLFVHSIQLYLNFKIKPDNTKTNRVYVLCVENCLLKRKLDPQRIYKLRNFIYFF